MELLFRLCLLIAGVINTLPALLAFIPSKIQQSYGIDIADANHELLLRHRAILFGIVGGYMIYAAVLKQHYSTAVLIGMISMVSFVGLYYSVNGQLNSELTKVMYIDLGAIVILVLGYICLKFK